jgi:hypothetical protein
MICICPPADAIDVEKDFLRECHVVVERDEVLFAAVRAEAVLAFSRGGEKGDLAVRELFSVVEIGVEGDVPVENSAGGILVLRWWKREGVPAQECDGEGELRLNVKMQQKGGSDAVEAEAKAPGPTLGSRWS